MALKAHSLVLFMTVQFCFLTVQFDFWFCLLVQFHVCKFKVSRPLFKMIEFHEFWLQSYFSISQGGLKGMRVSKNASWVHIIFSCSGIMSLPNYLPCMDANAMNNTKKFVTRFFHSGKRKLEVLQLY